MTPRKLRAGVDRTTMPVSRVFLRSLETMTIEELEQEIAARDAITLEARKALRELHRSARVLGMTVRVHDEIARAAMAWLAQKRAELEAPAVAGPGGGL